MIIKLFLSRKLYIIDIIYQYKLCEECGNNRYYCFKCY